MVCVSCDALKLNAQHAASTPPLSIRSAQFQGNESLVLQSPLTGESNASDSDELQSNACV